MGRLLDANWDRLVTFYQFPEEYWNHLRTTNPIESRFAVVRLRTTAAKRYKKMEHATAVIRKTPLIAEQTFRRPDAPERLGEIAEGATYVNEGERHQRHGRHEWPGHSLQRPCFSRGEEAGRRDRMILAGLPAAIE